MTAQTDMANKPGYDGNGFPIRGIAALKNIFIGGELIGAGTGTTTIQLWNPADSGVNLTVQSLAIKAGGATDVFTWKTSAALSTALTYDGANLDFSGVAPKAEMYTEDGATISGTKIQESNMPTANIFRDYWELVGAKVTPGTGIALQTVATISLMVACQWQESDV